MRCLCCGKTLAANASQEEMRAGWHKSCIKKFFGKSSMPQVSISAEALEKLAAEYVGNGYTVTGVQKKLSLALSDEDGVGLRLSLMNYPTGYILKPQTAEFRALPEAEYLVMSMAEATKIKTVPFALVQNSSELAYITKRIDRVAVDEQGEDADSVGVCYVQSSHVHKLAMEDFCQLDGRLTEDKYKGSYERCAKVVQKYSSTPGLDMADLFLRIVFSFAVGNSDMHLKNFSLIETAEGSGIYHLSEAYDMLPANVVMPADTEELALTLNGKKKNIRRKDFLAFAEKCGIGSRAAEKMIGKIVSLEDKYIKMCRDSYLPEDMKEALENLIKQRIATLAGK